MSKPGVADTESQNAILSDENLDLISAGFDAAAYAAKLKGYKEADLDAEYESVHTTARGLLKMGFNENSDIARLYRECRLEINCMKAEYAARHLDPPFRS